VIETLRLAAAFWLAVTAIVFTPLTLTDALRPYTFTLVALDVLATLTGAAFLLTRFFSIGEESPVRFVARGATFLAALGYLLRLAVGVASFSQLAIIAHFAQVVSLLLLVDGPFAPRTRSRDARRKARR
jgi:hypothetical protein